MSEKKSSAVYVPFTLGGSMLAHLEAKTEQGAWDKLMTDAAHMPYNGKAEFQARGYTVAKMEHD